jgi:pyridoxal phosphate enzyme (YggS family)
MVHSVDSERVAKALNHEAKKQGKRLPILVQVNMSGEESKFGVAQSGVVELIRKIAVMENLQVRGLMTIPPYFQDPELARPLYRRLREIAKDVAALNIRGVAMNDLSMGMSHDFEMAVEEGATWVRIGTALFGERN